MRVLTSEEAKRLIHQRGQKRSQQILVLLAASTGPTDVGALKRFASAQGLRGASRWNVSDILRKSNGAAILTTEGWELTDHGRKAVHDLARGGIERPLVDRTVAEVRSHLKSIASDEARGFIEEAVSCFEGGHLRAAVVLSWVGAISILSDAVIRRCLSEFNAEARRRNASWKIARTPDEIGVMKEYEFLEVLVAIAMIGKNVKQALQGQCLTLRNSCGHPNSLKIGESSVAAHLELLILNVFGRDWS